jgi:tRNA dimethylallyltransferase
LVATFLDGRELPDPASLSELARSTLSQVFEAKSYDSSRVRRLCEVCNKATMTDKEWHIHMDSRGHKKAVQSKQRKAENKAYLQQELIRSIEASNRVPDVDVPS